MPRSDALTRLDDWIDARTDYRAAVAVLRNRVVPGGPRWSYATGACTLGLFAVVAVTGVLLMTGYSPASDHGWSSVFLIESTPAGSFLRGVHYWGSHVLVVVFAVHVAREVLAASFRAPRELAWISSVLLLPLLAVAAVTGNPLSASNKAFAQIEVESHIVGSMPVVGSLARGVMVGGADVGNLTLTRLYALHVVILPLLALLLLVFHLWQQLRWGSVAEPEGTTGMPGEPSPSVVARSTEADVPYWPSQSARNALVFGLAFGVVAWLAWRYGAPLGVPADPTLDEMPRPEWYFRSLFELRNYFSGPAEFVATGLLPALFLVFLIALPWIDRFLPRRASVAFRYAVVIVATGGWAALTAVSISKDRSDELYRDFLVKSDERADRAIRLAEIRGIPPHGPATLLQSDPLTQGPRLFQRHCATCHPHIDHDGKGIPALTQRAANLHGFAGRDWIAGLLDPEQITSPSYYGHTAFVTAGTSAGMIDYVKDELYAVEPEELAARKEQVRKAVLALSAEARLPAQKEADKTDKAVIAEGRALLAGDELGCVNCHKFGDAGDLGAAPDLTGYGSRDWLSAFVANPGHERFYDANNDGMPAFLPGKPGSPANIVSREELMLIVDWLRGDWPE